MYDIGSCIKENTFLTKSAEQKRKENVYKYKTRNKRESETETKYNFSLFFSSSFLTNDV